MKSYVLACHIWIAIGQSQPKVTIWVILAVLNYPISHIKFQGHRSIGFREKVFEMYLLPADMAIILVVCPGPF